MVWETPCSQEYIKLKHIAPQVEKLVPHQVAQWQVQMLYKPNNRQWWWVNKQVHFVLLSVKRMQPKLTQIKCKLQELKEEEMVAVDVFWLMGDKICNINYNKIQWIHSMPWTNWFRSMEWKTPKTSNKMIVFDHSLSNPIVSSSKFIFRNCIEIK
jgi:hypothetical protein